MGIQEGLLFITSSGGAGHIRVMEERINAEKKALGILNTSDDPRIVKRDVMYDFLGTTIGGFCVNKWNQAQKEGNLQVQAQLVSRQWLADWIFFVPLFVQTLRTLFSMHPAPMKVVNTQVMGCCAILKAVRLYNLIQRRRCQDWKDVNVELWMTDLVSKKACHFLNPLKSLCEEDRKILSVKIPSSEPKDLELFVAQTGLSREKIQGIKDEDLPVRDIFKSEELKEYAPSHAHPLTLNVELNEEQKQHLQSLPTSLNPEFNGCQIEADDIVYSISLGSQPTAQVIKDCVLDVINGQKNSSDQRKMHFFVFCGRDEEGKPSLFKEVCQIVKNQEDFPENLSLIPLPFQKPDNIAKILARSNKKFTRAGGATCFELKAMQHTLGDQAGQVYFVSEAKLSKEELDKIEDSKERTKLLRKEIPVWEGGNAKKMMKAIHAKIVNPATFKDELFDFHASVDFDEEDLDGWFDLLLEASLSSSHSFKELTTIQQIVQKQLIT